MSSPIFQNLTYRFTGPVTKDGEVWDLTGAAVTLIFRKPDGSVAEKTATVEDAGAGMASYTTAVNELYPAGEWKRQWHVVQGEVNLMSDVVTFSVVKPLADP